MELKGLGGNELRILLGSYSRNTSGSGPQSQLHTKNKLTTLFVNFKWLVYKQQLPKGGRWGSCWILPTQVQSMC